MIGRSNIVGKPVAQLAAGRERDRHGRAFQDARSAGGVPPRRPPGRRRRPAGNGARRLDQAGRDRDRRRHQPRAGRDGKTRLVGDVAFAEASAGRGRDHAGAGRRRPDDHRLPDGQHAARGLRHRAGCRSRRFEASTVARARPMRSGLTDGSVRVRCSLRRLALAADRQRAGRAARSSARLHASSIPTRAASTRSGTRGRGLRLLALSAAMAALTCVSAPATSACRSASARSADAQAGGAAKPSRLQQRL